MTPSTDAAGNLTQDAQGRQYSYNNAERLDSITDNGQTIAEYRYNGNGQRTHKIVGNATTIYHYNLSGQLIAETSNNGTPLREQGGQVLQCRIVGRLLLSI